MIERDVFQQVIEACARESGGGRDGVTARRHVGQASGSDEVQGAKGHGKAQKQDFHGLKIPEQHLGTHKRDAPDDNGKKRRGMTDGSTGHVHKTAREGPFAEKKLPTASGGDARKQGNTVHKMTRSQKPDSNGIGKRPRSGRRFSTRALRGCGAA